MDQAHLQRVVDGIGAGLIEREAGGVGVDAIRLNLVRRRAERGAIGRAQNIEIGSLRAGVGQIQNPTGRKGGLRAEVPDLRVAVLIEGIDRLGIRNELSLPASAESRSGR